MEAWTAVRAKHLATKRGIAGELFFSNCFSVAFLPSYFVGILRLNIVFGGIKSQELLIRLGGGGVRCVPAFVALNGIRHSHTPRAAIRQNAVMPLDQLKQHRQPTIWSTQTRNCVHRKAQLLSR
jgi:hypothetical protein